MPATVSGSKTVTRPLAPHLTAATLTDLLGTAIENMTVAQLHAVQEALDRVPGGNDRARVIGALLN